MNNRLEINGLPEIRAYEDGVALGIELREGRDSFSWPLGDLINLVCSPSSNGGRPRLNGASEARSLATFCRDIGLGASTGSVLRTNAMFWDTADRAKMPPQIAWHHCAEAHRRSGWHPTMGPPTREHKERAWRFVGEYAEEVAAPPRTPALLADLIEAEQFRLEKLQKNPEATMRISAFLSDAVSKLEIAKAWCRVEPAREGVK